MRRLILICLVINCVICHAQDSLATAKSFPDSIQTKNDFHKSPIKAFIVPTTLIGIGIVGSNNGWFKHQNYQIREELQEGIDSRVTIDDFSQYAPTVAVFGLKAFNINSTHPFKEQAIITGMSFIMMGILVNSLKYTFRIERPDGSSHNSFPSGHTATAFLGADILYHEYKDVSPWIGYAGYAVATATGFFRMYNNRHWLTDVIAGAGIGMLTSRLSYWLYPKIFCNTNKVKKHQPQVAALPYCSKNSAGLCMSINF